jgi:hypothetical protein
MKKLFLLLSVALILSGCTVLSKDDIRKFDDRNAQVDMSIKRKILFSSSIIIIDVENVAGVSAIDLFRSVLQSAQELKDNDYKKVEFAKKGDSKFYIDGGFFKTLGREYGEQNILYTVRTFPEHVYNMDGSKAFSDWYGGVLGVMSNQMKDFNTFISEWVGD